jgi:aminoglycoside phosphotransferase (APT) family kinase protein
MDYEYNDDVEENGLEYFAQLIRDYPISDDDVRNVFRTLITGDDDVLPHDMFHFNIRDSDINDTRITRICKSMSNHLFRIQFLNGDKFIVRMNTNQSYEGEIEIINAVAGVGVEVPRNYFSHTHGIQIGRHRYYAMLQEHLDGVDFEQATHRKQISTSDKEVILAEMGKKLKAVHGVTTINGVEQENFHTRFFAEALDQLNHERDLILSEGICGKDEFESVYEKIDSLRDTAELFGGYGFGLAHMDYHPKHVMLDLSAGRPVIRAIIDWGDATFTNTYFDFALWDFWCGDDFLIDSLMESYGMEAFASAESKVNVELTTIAALIKELCIYAHMPEFKATQLGLWQRLLHEVTQATY